MKSSVKPFWMIKLILGCLLFSLQVTAQLLTPAELESAPVQTSLQEALGDSTGTIKLILKKQKFTTIPQEIFALTSLQYLDLSRNKIDSIPADIRKLKNLQVLILSSNQISSLPPEIYQLKNLRILRLGKNSISYISKQIIQLEKLEVLDLWNNEVSQIPYELGQLPNLKEIDFRGISLNIEQQEAILEIIPDTVTVYLSPPCNCSF